MTISVVIPTFNRAQTLAQAISSVLSQTRSVFEIIVVDDGSTDNTADLLRSQFSLPLVRCLEQKNAGAGAARNLGLTAVRGEWVAFLDSDDYWLPDKIEHFEEAIASFQDADFFYTVTNQSQHAPAFDHQNGFYRRIDAEAVLSSFSVKTSTVLVRKSLIQENKLLFGTKRTCEDYEFFWKAACVARSIVCSSFPDSIIGSSIDSLMVAQNGWKIFRDNVQAIDHVLSWMAVREINLSLHNKLEELRYWQIRNAMSASVMDGRYVELCNFFRKAWMYYGLLKAARLAYSSAQVVLSRHNRAWLRSYALPKDSKR